MSSVKKIEISSLGDLLDQATPRQPDPASGRLRNYSLFRGVSDLNGSLLTGLDRLGGWNPPHTKGHLEEHIFRNFIRYATPHLVQKPSTEWEMLITAQHHGIPTRLLDWTYSPLVAAHFATLPHFPGGTRAVWKLDWKSLHQHFNLQPLAFLVSDLGKILEEKGFSSIWDLFKAKTISRTQRFVCMIEPPGIDSRIVAQAAAFTLCAEKDVSLEDVLMREGLESSLTLYLIPDGVVEFVRDQLDLCSFDERRFFPDLDGIAAVLRRYYDADSEKPRAGRPST